MPQPPKQLQGECTMTVDQIKIIAEMAGERAANTVIERHTATCPVEERMTHKIQLQWWKLICLLMATGTLSGGIVAKIVTNGSVADLIKALVNSGG